MDGRIVSSKLGRRKIVTRRIGFVHTTAETERDPRGVIKIRLGRGTREGRRRILGGRARKRGN